MATDLLSPSTWIKHMYGNRYFGKRYFGDRYFGPGGTTVVVVGFPGHGLHLGRLRIAI